MVVEDDDGVRELVRLMLEANGYEVLDRRTDADEAARVCTERRRRRPAADRRDDARGQRPRARRAARRARPDDADPVHVRLLRRGRPPPRRCSARAPRSSRSRSPSATLARKVREVLDARPLDDRQRGWTASMRAATAVRRVEREGEELVGLVVGHRPVGEQGVERRASVGDARRAGRRRARRSNHLGLRGHAAPGAAVRGGVEERGRGAGRREQRDGLARKRARIATARTAPAWRARLGLGSSVVLTSATSPPARASGSSAASTGTRTLRLVPSFVVEISVASIATASAVSTTRSRASRV